MMSLCSKVEMGTRNYGNIEANMGDSTGGMSPGERTPAPSVHV